MKGSIKHGGVLVLLVLLLSAVSASAVTIKIAHWMGPAGSPPLMAAIREKLEPLGIQVEEVVTDATNYRDKVLTLVLGGVGPDVIMESPYQYPLQTAGIFMDLTDRLRNDKTVNFDAFIPSVWSMYSYWGGTWLVPAGVSPYLLHYNRQHFNEAGLAYPTGLWRWDREVAEAAKKLQVIDANGAVSRYGLLLENRPWTLVFSNGGNILSADGTRGVLDSANVVEITSLVQDWRKNNLIPAAADHRTPFIQGKGSMLAVMGTFAWRAFARPADFDWGVTYVPLGNGPRSIDENTIGWGTCATTAHPEEAWEVVKALVSVRATITMDSLIHFPPMKNKLDNEAIAFVKEAYKRSNEEIQITMDSVNYVRPSLRHPKGSEIMSIATAAVRDVMFNGKSPIATLGDANSRINAVLKD